MSEHVRARTLQLLATVAGAPLAWLVQINLVYPLVADPCFTASQRELNFPPEGEWSFVAAVLISVSALLVSVASAWLSIRLLRRFQAGEARAQDHFEEREIGRVRFASYCGMLLGIGFSVLILLNALALILVPPCAL